uniref:Uncharacterized protein n=1 Tax=Anopheles triannulatus TaxID=58253 RepID=A0A2M4AZ08_9DIPT
MLFFTGFSAASGSLISSGSSATVSCASSNTSSSDTCFSSFAFWIDSGTIGSSSSLKSYSEAASFSIASFFAFASSGGCRAESTDIGVAGFSSISGAVDSLARIEASCDMLVSDGFTKVLSSSPSSSSSLIGSAGAFDSADTSNDANGLSSESSSSTMACTSLESLVAMGTSSSSSSFAESDTTITLSALSGPLASSAESLFSSLEWFVSGELLVLSSIGMISMISSLVSCFTSSTVDCSSSFDCFELSFDALSPASSSLLLLDPSSTVGLSGSGGGGRCCGCGVGCEGCGGSD